VNSSQQSIGIGFLLSLLLLTVLPGYSAEYTWSGSAFDGDGVSWNDGDNWSTDGVNPAGSPSGNLDMARIKASSGPSEYPTIQNGISAVCGGLFMGLDNITHLPGATLTIAVGGNLTTYPSPAHGDWNPGLQLGWYSDCVLNTAGTIDTQDGWIDIGKGTPENSYGGVTLNITGGTITTPNVQFNGVSICHIQLDGGTLYAGAVTGLGGADQSLDITGGQLVIDGDVRDDVDSWVTTGHLAAYSGSGSIERSYNTLYPNKTTVTAIDNRAICD